MPIIFGKLAVCDVCDTVYWLADWDSDWDVDGCPVCREEIT